MRWGYKTVQFGLKKEGLLGGSFLDEAEVEQSLNEFGQAGWELVSLFGMQDGLMAVFKQPLEVVAQVEVVSAHEPAAEETVAVPYRFSLNRQGALGPEAAAERRTVNKRAVVSARTERDKTEEGVGEIRIE